LKKENNTKKINKNIGAVKLLAQKITHDWLLFLLGNETICETIFLDFVFNGSFKIIWKNTKKEATE